MQRAFFVIVHSAMSAAIIHLVNISTQNTTPAIAVQATNYLSDNLRMLYEMQTTYPIMGRYVKVIRGLISKWVPVVPDNVRDALHAVDQPSPVSSNGDSALNPPEPISNTHASAVSDTSCSPTHAGNMCHRPPAPDLIQMTPNLNDGIGSTTTGSRDYLWTPFPEKQEGVPVMPPERISNENMDISRMLDSGVDGDWPQLNRDGFTMHDRGEFWRV